MTDINELKLMTYMARAENEPQLRKSIITVRAYRSDYLIKHGIYAFIMGSLIFFIVMMIVALFNLEAFTTAVFTDSFMPEFRRLLVKYGVFITIFVGLNIIVYNFRYTKYYNMLMSYRKMQRQLIKYKSEGEIDDQTT